MEITTTTMGTFRRAYPEQNLTFSKGIAITILAATTPALRSYPPNSSPTHASSM